MDPVKVVIFVVAFLLLLLLGRKLSGGSESAIHAPPLPPLPHTEAVSSNKYAEAELETKKLPAAIGAEIPFPVAIPPLRQNADGRYSRPEFVNYHFQTIDLVTGPADPTCFYDHLFLQTRDPEGGNPWTNKFTVATPAGLQRVMKEEALAALYLDAETIIVPRWDLEAIMGAMVQQIIRAYQEPNDMEEPSPDQVLPES